MQRVVKDYSTFFTSDSSKLQFIQLIVGPNLCKWFRYKQAIANLTKTGSKILSVRGYQLIITINVNMYWEKCYRR